MTDAGQTSAFACMTQTVRHKLSWACTFMMIEYGRLTCSEFFTVQSSGRGVV